MEKKINKENQNRLAQALRVNLLKRKTQQRSRINVGVDKQHEGFFFHETDRGFFINIRLTPNAKNDEIGKIYTSPEDQTYLKISVKDVPEDGQANTALICFIASKLKFPKTHIILVKGATSRFKTLLLQDENTQDLKQKLEKLINC